MSGDVNRAGDAVGDLTRIGGIGPKIAQRLNTAGIRAYADLASRSAEEIAALLQDVSGLSTAKIDSWRGKARDLALATSVQAVPEFPVGDGQRYESFLIRVLLNENGSIRRTTARHIRTGAERHWPGLEREALPDFIEMSIGSLTCSPEGSAAEAADQAQHADATLPGRLPIAEVRAAPTGAERASALSSAMLTVGRTPLRAAEPFTLTMAIELAEASNADRFAYSAVIVAVPLTGGPKQTIARSDGLLAPTSSAISICAAGLPHGTYRLDGAVSLREPATHRPVHLAGIAEGLLVQVLPD